MPSPTTITALLGRYDGFLLDAYGVLVDKAGPLPGAVELVERLNREDRRYCILTNAAAHLPEAMAADFAALGLMIPAERFVTSGLLLAGKGLAGHRCLLLGPPDSAEYLRRAGGLPVAPQAGAEAEAVVIADQKGFDLQQGLNAALSLILRRLDAGLPLALLLCNPDLIYPVARGEYGLTAGGLAAALEAVLSERYGADAPRFRRLGKPHRPIFEEALRRIGTRNAVMLGDQLATDILGAKRCGIDAALVATGLAGGAGAAAEAVPDWHLDNLLGAD